MNLKHATSLESRPRFTACNGPRLCPQDQPQRVRPTRILLSFPTRSVDLTRCGWASPQPRSVNLIGCIFAVLLLAFSINLHAAYRDDWARMKDITPRRYLCYQAATPVQIDGKLDDTAWQAAPWTEYFVDIEGAAKPKPRHRTRAKMLWDDQYFYVAAELEEPHVWGTLTNHDAVIFHDPDFEVFIDPDGDSHEYYEFEINALNNDQEYFAEATEAFFGTNDYFPFVRAELKQHDPEMFELLHELWGVRPAKEK